MVKRVWGRLIGSLAALGLMAGAAAAVTAPILVVDAESGKVLYSQGATDPWYPASITKLMTTYVALDMVRQGKVSLDTLLTVSPAAAAEPPSKMGFKPGTQITLDNALKIIMVKSANDVSWAIGEGLGGSVEGFADMMNETAHRIGMRESRWYNPNGLPEPRQWTSARDMAILARALMRDFPNQQALFSISAIQFGKSVMANHNGLLGRYPGADGMKTGFICSGGFNVVATATRGGRRIIAVVMGQPSARERDIKAADLFDYGFGQSAGWTAPTLESLPPSNVAAPPDMRPYICDKRKPIPVDEGPGALTASGPGADSATTQLLGSATPDASNLAFAALGNANVRGRTLPPRAPLQPIPVWIGSSPTEGAMALAREEQEAQAAKQAAKQAALEAAQRKRAEAKAAKDAARQAASEKAAKARAAAVTAPKPAAKTAAKDKGADKGVPAATSAYTSVEAAPKAAAKPAAKPAHKPAAKKPEAKPEAKPAAKKADKKAKNDES
ncbi:D-alanyl-D-alanine carboxypeptidase [Methylorubrum populi]|uniref:D-alanyl-D-alanine carboxypeptidase family protein n=1 Tax=Methylorubrum populi TaxID=223967 RepID=UPI001154E571|nr:D-alanyl-D-alanine carboxypeptidase family protein [Methylorubrum populi]QDI80034.1 D-alanyl-D-alanine carboxypeptidase [Methylorubrum populi]